MLREIESRFCPSAGLSGDDAVESICARLAQQREQERDVVTTFQIPEVVMVDLFWLLCDRYGVEGEMASKRSRRSFTVVAPRSFINQVFAPIFNESSDMLLRYVIEATHGLLQDAYEMKSEGPSVTLKPRSE